MLLMMTTQMMIKKENDKNCKECWKLSLYDADNDDDIADNDDNDYNYDDDIDNDDDGDDIDHEDNYDDDDDADLLNVQNLTSTGF